MMKVFLLLMGLCFNLTIPQSSFASEAQMRESLVKIISELQAIKPMIGEAQREQPAHSRIQIHFERFSDHTGKRHNGLRQDLEAIQQALIDVVNRESVEPRTYPPLQADFVK